MKDKANIFTPKPPFKSASGMSTMDALRFEVRYHYEKTGSLPVALRK